MDIDQATSSYRNRIDQIHGGDLDRAIAKFGGRCEDWLDLSTGINPNAYPLPAIASDCWQRLPTKADMAGLAAVAAAAFDTSATVLPIAGAQFGIQLLPQLMDGADARILTPTYGEYAGVLGRAAWKVRETTELEDLAGADLAVVVNPNNPDGRLHAPERLKELSSRVGLLVVDESFAEVEAAPSLAPWIDPPDGRMMVLRSFGKFYGLAGLRLGFTISGSVLGSRIAALAGPWPVSGPAIAVARQALADRPWQEATRTNLRRSAERLDRLAQEMGWRLVGGTSLFRTYATPDAAQTQAILAKRRVWTRIFRGDPHVLRLGLPGNDPSWVQLKRAMAGL